jgi:hypothetical protein
MDFEAPSRSMMQITVALLAPEAVREVITQHLSILPLSHVLSYRSF